MAALSTPSVRRMHFLIPLIAGAVYVASPGPVLVSTIRWGLHAGMRGGMSVQLGAFCGDLPFIAMAAVGFGGVVDALPSGAVTITSAIVLVLYGLLALRDPTSGVPFGSGAPAGPATISLRFTRTGFVEGLVLAVTNPLSVAFWLSATAGTGATQVADRLPVALGGFFAGNLTCAVILAAGVSLIHRRTRPRFWHGVARICGLALISFGLIVGLTAL